MQQTPDDLGSFADDFQPPNDVPYFDMGKKTPVMQFKCLTEIRKNLIGPQYVVKPFIEKDTTGIVFGESGAYKSFVVIDLGLCVAHGIDYHGSVVHRGPVFYICGEGHGGIGRRIEAWHIANNIECTAPFYVSELPAQILEEDNAESVAGAIREISKEHDQDPVLIIVDTLSTNIGDGDENNNADIAQFLVEINTKIRKPFGAAVIIVHHVGHGSKDRERGAYGIRGNTDFRILIKPEIGYRCSMHSLKMKDGPEFEAVAFQTNVVTIPGVFDSEGDEVTSLAVSMTDYVPEENVQKLSGQKAQALAFLKEMYRVGGENLERHGRKASEARVFTKDWLDRLQNCEVIKNYKQARTKIKKALLDAHMITEEGKFVYLVAIAGEEK